MLCIISGPAGGTQLDLASSIACRRGPAYWFAVDHQPQPPQQGATMVFTPPRYEALATLAERLAHPDGGLLIADLDAMRNRRPPERKPTIADLQDAPELQTIAQLAKRRAPLAPILVVHSLSRIYEQAIARVVAQWGGQYEEEGLKAARALASDAIARLSWDLAHAEGVQWAVATAWEVETTLKGKVTGSAPMLPKATLNHADLWLRAEPVVESAFPLRFTVMGGAGKGFKIGETISANEDDRWSILADTWKKKE